MWEHRDWIVGIMTATAIWLEGDKNKWGWAIGFITELLWITILVEKQLWGLFPCTLVVLFIDIRNFNRWSKREEICCKWL